MYTLGSSTQRPEGSSVKPSIILHSVKAQLQCVIIIEFTTFYYNTSFQGIGPTLIAFRVSRERSQTEVDSTNQIGPLSRLNFRKAAHGTSTNCESAHAQGSNIRLASSNEGEHINGMQTPVVAEVQTHATDAEDKKVLARLKNVRSLESV